MTLAESDLYTQISKTELDALVDTLVEVGQADPVATAIAEALGVIKLYVDPFTVADDALAKLWKTLSVCWLYNRVSEMPEKRKAEEKWALGVLEGIRDGKHPNLVVDTTLAVTGQASWGGKAKVAIVV
jgi:hypothetical protein